MSIRLGTRRSTLATTQAGMVADLLRGLGHTVEMVEITTLGDTSTETLSSIGGTGVFATAIRRALLSGEIDVAVHSLKDLPVAPEPGLRIAAIPVREDPRDALVARDGLTLGELPAGSVVGTGSPRRVAQLTALGLGLRVTDLRGNVDTRIGLVHNGSLDAVFSRVPGWHASAGWMWSPRPSTPCRCSRLRGKGPSPSSAARIAQTASRRWH